MEPAPATMFVGTVEREFRGRVFPLDVILCCPGDWHRIKATLDNPEGWSTLRLGAHLLALSPTAPDFAAFLDELIDGRRPADAVAPGRTV